MAKKTKKQSQGAFLNRFNFLIHTFCDNSTIRPEMSGVFVSPKETCATDSFKMIKVDTPKNINADDYPLIPNKPKPLTNFKSFILPQEKAKDVLSIFNNQKKTNNLLPILENAVVIRNDKESVEIGKTDLASFQSIVAKKIEGTFPSYNELFVERGKFVEIEVNPKLLKQIVDFYISFVDTPHTTIKIKIPIKKEERAIRFYGKRQSGQEAKAILMTMEV